MSDENNGLGEPPACVNGRRRYYSVCRNCGKHLPKPARGPMRKYCDDRCRKQYGRKQRRRLIERAEQGYAAARLEIADYERRRLIQFQIASEAKEQAIRLAQAAKEREEALRLLRKDRRQDETRQLSGAYQSTHLIIIQHHVYLMPLALGLAEAERPFQIF